MRVIGGGFAGCEAAWQAAERGIRVELIEMRPVQKTDAHKTDGLAELVCSNSFRSDDAETNAVGLLHEEMRRCGSLVMQMAEIAKVPAGSALAVDRDLFSDSVTQALERHPNINISRALVTELPSDDGIETIIATGPLTAAPLANAILNETGEDSLAFFDAIAPIVHFDTIDMEKAWFQSRYDKAGPGGTGADYINCPLSRDEYEAFIDALLAGDQTEFKEWENTPYFEGCLPIEVMAARGRETLRFGPFKPVGLTNPHNPDVKPYAVIQLRQDNKLGTLFNMVGFQTKLKYGAQKEIFQLIPGLENASFARLGGLHRNTFINSPILLDETLRLKTKPRIRFAGQITGCEGYVESAAIGMLAGRFAAQTCKGTIPTPPPPETAFGALLSHITGGHISDNTKRSFQPMNVNFGLFPPLSKDEEPKRVPGQKLKKVDRTRLKKMAMTTRALKALEEWQKHDDETSLQEPAAE